MENNDVDEPIEELESIEEIIQDELQKTKEAEPIKLSYESARQSDAAHKISKAIFGLIEAEPLPYFFDHSASELLIRLIRRARLGNGFAHSTFSYIEIMLQDALAKQEEDSKAIGFIEESIESLSSIAVRYFEDDLVEELKDIHIAEIVQHFVDDPSVVADYDGDGKADLAVYREGRTTGEQSFLWYRPSSNPNGGFVAVPWGIRGDEPCPPGDYDGDQKADPCVRRGYGKNPATFFVLKSGGGITYNNYGFGSDQMVNADYDGDFKTDFAVIRAQEMVSAAPPIDWYFQTSGGQYYGATFGLGGEFGDRPTVGDYDGDGRSDIAVWRPPTGIFYAQNAAGLSAHQWGIQNDKLANSTGYLSKLPAGWTVMYDKLGSGGQGWGFIGQGHANSQFSLPSMQSYNVSANRFEKGDVSKYLRRAEIATRTLVNGVDTGDLTTVAGYALRIWDGNSSSTFFIHPMNGVVANNQTYGNFTNPTLGSTTSPVYVSNTGANRPFYLGWNNLNISIANVASAHVSIQLGRDALSKMNAIGIYASTFGGLGAMGITESGNGVFYNLPLAYRLITSE